jgi:uncharacterized protein YndB with AHSA1/START domain
MIEVTHRYDVSSEKVFDAFLSTDVARHFLFATAGGDMIVAEIEPRVGGHFTFTERRPEMGDVRHVGHYLDIERPRRLVFNFSVPQFAPGASMVTIEIRSQDGGCELVLIAENMQTDHLEGVRDAWKRILAGLLPAYDGLHGAGWR